MFSERSDTIVTLGHGGIDKYGQVDTESLQRVQTAVELFNNGSAKTITMSGFKPFTDTSRGEVIPEAEVMKDAALHSGVPEKVIFTETQSLDTIGNAYFVKKTVLEPNKWKTITLVTSPSHLERSRRIFTHVLGKDYKISTVASEEASRKAQGLYEAIGNILERQVLGGVEEGNDAEVYARLQYLIPGYAETHAPQLFMNHLTRIAKRHSLLK